MNTDRLYLLLSLYKNVICIKVGTEDYKWLWDNGYISLPDFKAGFVLTERGRMAVDFAVKKAGEF